MLTRIITTRNDYFSQYNTPNVTPDWSYYFSKSSTTQKWNQDGKTKYAGINFSSRKEGKEFFGYARYSESRIDLSSNSIITDTSYNSSRWINTYNNENTIYDYSGNSLVSDLRSASGLMQKKKLEYELGFRWQLTSFNTISVGLYGSSAQNEITDNEPVIALRRSDYVNNNSSGQNYSYSYRLFENKMLEWKYSADYWTLQIPILLSFKLNDNFELMLGVNRILNAWEINDQTTAYFTVREQSNNGEVKNEKNFGERYSQPRQRITENSTDFITRLNVSITPAFNINLLVDPEFESMFRIAQWWLAFNTEL